MDVGLLLVRLVIGALMFGHGTQKLFGWFGGYGPDATAQFFGSLGYSPARRMALLAGTAEAAGGALLALGFFTPFAAAAIIGVMINAIGSVHADKGPWVTNGGWEYPAVLAATVAAIAFVGPGKISLDAAADTMMRGAFAGFLAAALGCLGGAVVLWSRAGSAAEEGTANPARREAA